MNFAPLEALLDEIRMKRLPGCEMLVTVEGKKAFDYHSRENKRFIAYSLTKPLTCVLALKFMERGAFTLNDKLSEYICEAADPKVAEKLENGSVSIRSAKRGILIRDLFTMSAGLSYDISGLKDETALEAARGILMRPLLFDPGTRWEYSLCHDVLGALIERISGTRLSTLMRREIFSPLDMSDSCFVSEITDISLISPQYSAKTLKPAAPDLRFTPGSLYDSGGAGLVTTTRDYSAFCEALISGNILSKAALELMTLNHLNGQALKDFNWPQLKGYGYGLGVRTLIDKTAGGALSPLGEFGWGGISGAYSLMDAKNGVTAVFMAHSPGTDEAWLYPRLRDVLYSCL